MFALFHLVLRLLSQKSPVAAAVVAAVVAIGLVAENAALAAAFVFPSFTNFNQNFSQSFNSHNAVFILGQQNLPPPSVTTVSTVHSFPSYMQTSHDTLITCLNTNWTNKTIKIHKT